MVAVHEFMLVKGSLTLEEHKDHKVICIGDRIQKFIWHLHVDSLCPKVGKWLKCVQNVTLGQERLK